LVLPDLRTVYVYSSIDEYEIYGKTEVLKDEQLNIEISLADLFK
jgi:hypothetical protein